MIFKVINTLTYIDFFINQVNIRFFIDIKYFYLILSIYLKIRKNGRPNFIVNK